MGQEDEFEDRATIEVRVGKTVETFSVPKCNMTPERLRSMAVEIQQAAEELSMSRFEPLRTWEKVSLYAAAGNLEYARVKLVELAEYLQLDEASASTRTCAYRKCRKIFGTYRRDQIGCYEHIDFTNPDEVARINRK
jgi:hypothetical protein